MQIPMPMSLALLAGAQTFRIVRIAPTHLKTEWTLKMAEFEGYGLVSAGAHIEIGDGVHQTNGAGLGFTETPRIVTVIDCETRAATKEWVIGWAGSPYPRTGASGMVVTLDPERFAHLLLDWVYENADGDNTPVELTGFGKDDVAADSVIPLAEHLAMRGFLHLSTTRNRGTATALKFSGLWGLVSGFPGLVTVWLHVGRGGVTGCGGP